MTERVGSRPAAAAPPWRQGPFSSRAVLNMYSPLSDVLGRDPVTVALHATVREALEAMERASVDSAVIVDPGRRIPLGVFTLHDLVRRVSLPGEDLWQPVAGVMTGGLITLTPRATAHQAALAMARHGVRRVVVVDDGGRLVGVVSQNDLFALQHVGVKEIGDQIQATRDVEGLRGAAAGIRRLLDGLLAQGTTAELIMHFTSTLSDLLTIRLIELTADGFDLPLVRMCWIALGSEGRLEQTLCTDQDNGLVFEASDEDAGRVREALLPFAQAVNRGLAECGFSLCRGGVMAGNPRWCLSLDEWRRTFSSWIHEPQPEALLNAAIFFDLRPIYGDEFLAERLRGWLLSAARHQPLFLRLMAENALQCQPPLGILHGFTCERSREFPHTIDLKTSGSRLFVDAARVFSLAHGLPDTSTAQRLRALTEVLRFASDGVAATLDAFHFIHLLRLRRQCRLEGGAEGANRIDPRDLNELDRHVLKEAFRQARKLQARLASDHRM